jgi:hypothetical protein
MHQDLSSSEPREEEGCLNRLVARPILARSRHGYGVSICQHHRSNCQFEELNVRFGPETDITKKDAQPMSGALQRDEVFTRVVLFLFA